MRRLYLALPLALLIGGCAVTPSEPTVYTGVIEDKVFEEGGLEYKAKSDTKKAGFKMEEDDYELYIDGTEYEVTEDEWNSVEKGDTVYYTLNWGTLKLVDKPAETEQEVTE